MSLMAKSSILQAGIVDEPALDQRVGAPAPTACSIIAHFALFFPFSFEKHEKSIFQPAFGVPSNQTLVKVYNLNMLSIKKNTSRGGSSI